MKKFRKITKFVALFTFFLLSAAGCGSNENDAYNTQYERDLPILSQELLQNFKDSCQSNGLEDFLSREECETLASLLMEEILRPIYQDELFFCLDCSGTAILEDNDAVWLSVMYLVYGQTMDFQVESERIGQVFTALKELPTDISIGIWVRFDFVDGIYYYFLATHDIIGYDLATYDFKQHFIEDGGTYGIPE